MKALLSREFDMKDLGETKKILGMEIRRDKALEDYGCLKVAMLGRCWRGSTWRMKNYTPLENNFRLPTT